MRAGTVAGSASPGEDGYALVAAVAAMLAFALMALSLATDTRDEVTGMMAQVQQARAAAAVDAGIAMAIHDLLGPRAAIAEIADGRSRWHALDDGARVEVAIVAENGLVPLNRLDEARATRLLRMAGLEGEALAIARDSLLDWQDGDDDARPDGAEFGYYSGQGLAPQNGQLTSVDELARIRGFTPALVDRLRPLVTVDPNARVFDPRRADPGAIAVMDGTDGSAVLAIERARAVAGQQTALAMGGAGALVGHPLVLRATARLPDGATAHREVVVELTRSAARPFLVRDYR